ncbi:ABC-type transport auxiliary lipoprotein family protein [uncultured Erythrobacter sp.]|uniref:ABC-type transport auxiliary lipoprotein family protein n=1 Tax=uncultured Erythrobacter sp. TaxID=263913 RepID=UPI002623AB51|nr:ABC-type transport auxiliary lipoprotein family protein [uncultured Erythrobacter sp.]
MNQFRTFAVLAAASLTLSGCISLGAAEPPESLLTLSSTATAPAGSGAVTGTEGSEGAIAVLTPEVPAKLDVLRVPVNVTDTEVAYLQDAVWIEKPARLFRRLLGETLRTRGAALVLDSDDTPTIASQTVRGTLIEMTYDVPTSSVVVRFDALRTGEDGSVTSRRFEASESGLAPEASLVGPALNRVANQVAGEVADWVVNGD